MDSDVCSASSRTHESRSWSSGSFTDLDWRQSCRNSASSPNGLVTNIVSFNVGVEIGQFLALAAVFIALSYWRTRAGFLRHAFVTNTLLMMGGFILVGYQIAGYMVTR